MLPLRPERALPGAAAWEPPTRVSLGRKLAANHSNVFHPRLSVRQAFQPACSAADEREKALEVPVLCIVLGMLPACGRFAAPCLLFVDDQVQCTCLRSRPCQCVAAATQQSVPSTSQFSINTNTHTSACPPHAAVPHSNPRHARKTVGLRRNPHSSSPRLPRHRPRVPGSPNTGSMQRRSTRTGASNYHTPGSVLPHGGSFHGQTASQQAQSAAVEAGAQHSVQGRRYRPQESTSGLLPGPGLAAHP